MLCWPCDPASSLMFDKSMTSNELRLPNVIGATRGADGGGELIADASANGSGLVNRSWEIPRCMCGGALIVAFSSLQGELRIGVGAQSPSLNLPPLAGVVSGVKRYFPKLQSARRKSAWKSPSPFPTYHLSICLLVCLGAEVRVVVL